MVHVLNFMKICQLDESLWGESHNQTEITSYVTLNVVFLMLSSQIPSTKLDKNASFWLLYNSLFTTYPTIRGYLLWAADNILNKL
jgi:hypothetical protein